MEKHGVDGYNKSEEFKDPKVGYIIKTFSRTNRKDYENYVVNSIWQRLYERLSKIERLQNGQSGMEALDNLCPVTQQYFKRTDKTYGLIDLYFPQINFSIECDESYHDRKTQKQRDEKRTNDLENSFAQLKKMMALDQSTQDWWEPKRINANVGYEELNKEINEVVDNIIAKIQQLQNSLIWDCKKPAFEVALENQKISVNDGLLFSTAWQYSECFYKHYRKGLQKTSFDVQNNMMVWGPILTIKKEIDGEEVLITSRSEWENYLSEDWQYIYETNRKEGVDWWMKEANPRNRIVFAKAKDTFGNNGFRFLGVYRFAQNDNKEKRRVWERIATEIDLKTFYDPYKQYCNFLRQSSLIVFNESFCDSDRRYVRFSTQMLETLFPVHTELKNDWGSGCNVLWELNTTNAGNSTTVTAWLAVNTSGLVEDEKEKVDKISRELGKRKLGEESSSYRWLQSFSAEIIDCHYSQENVYKALSELIQQIEEFEQAVLIRIK